MEDSVLLPYGPTEEFKSEIKCTPLIISAYGHDVLRPLDKMQESIKSISRIGAVEISKVCKSPSYVNLMHFNLHQNSLQRRYVIFLGLLPLLWETGIGADVSARTAAPLVGGLWSCMVLTLLVLPAAYAMWRRGQVRAALRARLRTAEA